MEGYNWNTGVTGAEKGVFQSNRCTHCIKKEAQVSDSPSKNLSYERVFGSSWRVLSKKERKKMRLMWKKGKKWRQKRQDVLRLHLDLFSAAFCLCLSHLSIQLDFPTSDVLSLSLLFYYITLSCITSVKWRWRGGISGVKILCITILSQQEREKNIACNSRIVVEE